MDRNDATQGRHYAESPQLPRSRSRRPAGLLALTRPGISPLLALGQPARADDDVLIMVQLSGGNDGLNTVAPVGDAAYRRARPRIGIAAKDALGLAPGLGLHPSLKGLHSIYGKGQLAIVQGVGYPGPNRSHFLSMDIWHVGDPSARDMRFGWLGRAMDSWQRSSRRRPSSGST